MACASLATLERLVYKPEGRALLAALKSERGTYLASFSKVDRLVLAGQRDEASRTVLSETLPALDRLQGRVDDLARLKKTGALAAGADAQADIDHAQTVLLAAGLVAGAFDHPPHRPGGGRSGGGRRLGLGRRNPHP